MSKSGKVVYEVIAVIQREKGSEVSTVEVGTDSEHLMLGQSHY